MFADAPSASLSSLRLLLFFVPVISGICASGPVKLSEYHFETFRTEQGLPQNTITCLCQTRDGYIWVGTPSGLARFDGIKFTVFDPLHEPEMGDNTSRDLAEDVDGSLWIATNDGLLRWKDHQFRRFTMANGLPWNGVRSVAASQSGGVWVGTSKGYARFQNGRFTNYNHLHAPITSRAIVFETKDGMVWISSGGGLWSLSGEEGPKLKIIADPSGFAGNRMHVFREGADGRLWFGNYGGLYCWDSGELRHFKYSEQIHTNDPEPDAVNTILETRSGELWLTLTSRHILHRFENGRFLPLTTPEGSLLDEVTSLLQDREGNIWIGTRYAGLQKLSRRLVSVYSVENGLGNDDIHTVCEDRDGAIWVGAERGHYGVIRESGVTSHVVPSGVQRPVLSICPDERGRLWFGLEGGNATQTLYHYDKGTLSPWQGGAGVESRFIWSLANDPAGGLLIGTGDGLRRLYNDQVTVQKSEGLPNLSVRALLRARDGALWVGTEGGLAQLRDGKVTVFTTTNGLSNDFICCLQEDREGAIWIGTWHGLNRYKNGSFATLTRRHGLLEDLVSTILQDNAGDFWLGGNRGIYRVRQDDLGAAMDGKAERPRVMSLGQADGMISSETYTGSQPSAWKGRDGRLWFATRKGVVVIDPDDLPENEIEPPVVIEHVSAGTNVVFGFGSPAAQQQQSENISFRLPPGGGRALEFHYTANSFAAPQKVAFKYRLEGHDPAWLDAGNRRVAYYTNLRPGHYRFRVQACNNHGKWNEAGAAVAFYLAPHIYQTWPFYALCAAAASLIGFALHRRRMAVLTRLQRLEHERAMHSERARIAQDMHDDLGASLTQVAILSEVAKNTLGSPETAAGHVERISATARAMVDSITEIIWAIGPRNDRLDNLCSFLREYAAQRCEEAGIACQLSFPGTVPPRAVSAEFRRNVLLILKEALSNVIKHSGAARVEIGLSLEPQPERCERLALTISDNGRGFDAESVSPFSNGIQNIRRRTSMLNGSLRLVTQSAAGTRLEFHLPIPGHANVARKTAA